MMKQSGILLAGKKTILTIVAAVAVSFMFTGCFGSYSQSALEYSREGTKRVEAGYDAKVFMTDSVLQYLAAANVNCGVKVEVINNIPVTTVKECIDLEDALKVVEKTEIVKPQKIAEMSQAFGDFLVKATNFAVPIAGIYYNTKLQEKSLEYNYLSRVNDNATQQSFWDTYTGTYNNSTVQVVEPSVHTITNTDTQIVEPTVVDPVIVNPVIVDNTQTDSQ